MNETKLDNINPDKIVRNPDNPRLIFRTDELEVLLNSIKEVGIQVPLSVYKESEKEKFVIMDGERRWLCAKKLNMKTVPAIIEPKPTRLENILRMFNIHNVRVQWDLLAIALKLNEVKKLLDAKGQSNSIKELAAVTGLTLATVKRAFDILTLPPKYLTLLKGELQKPKSEQKFSEDFFLEMMRAIKAMENYVPQIFKKHSKTEVMDNFVKKYEQGVINNIVKFRNISKIARSEKAGIPTDRSLPILNKLISDPKYSIDNAFGDSVADAYESRTLKRDIESLIKKLRELEKTKLDKEMELLLKQLIKTVKSILE